MKRFTRTSFLFAITIALAAQPINGIFLDLMGAAIKGFGGAVEGAVDAMMGAGNTMISYLDNTKCHGTEGTRCNHYIALTKFGEPFKKCGCDEGLYCNPIFEKCYRFMKRPTEAPTSFFSFGTRPRPTTKTLTTKVPQMTTTKAPQMTTTKAPQTTTTSSSKLTCAELKDTAVCKELLDILNFNSDPNVEEHYVKYCDC